MNREFQQYRFARIEARNITRARLEAQFKDGIGGMEEIEKAIVALHLKRFWRTLGAALGGMSKLKQTKAVS
jgi:hypothetical protein